MRVPGRQKGYHFSVLSPKKRKANPYVVEMAGLEKLLDMKKGFRVVWVTGLGFVAPEETFRVGPKGGKWP